MFFIKNVRQESADEDAGADRAGRTRLVHSGVGSFNGGGRPGGDRPPLARTGAAAGAVASARHYAALALVFAEMAGRKQLWETELEGFNMQESEDRVAERRQEAKKIGGTKA